jgi:hypothetical protein
MSKSAKLCKSMWIITNNQHTISYRHTVTDKVEPHLLTALTNDTLHFLCRIKQGAVLQLRFEFRKILQSENEQFNGSTVPQFNSSTVHNSVIKLCSDGNNIRHVVQNYVVLCDNKMDRVSEGMTSNVETARDHHSNDINNTEEQTYGLFCSSFTFTQTRPCSYRTEWCISLPCVMLYETLYARLFLQPQSNLNITDIIAWQRMRTSQRTHCFTTGTLTAATT